MKISKNKYSSLSKALLKKLFDIDIDDIARYIQKLQVQCKQLQSSANAISNENDELKKQLKESKDRYQKLDAQHITLEEQLSEEKASRIELQQHICTLQESNASAEQNIATLKTENDKLHKKFDEQITLNQQSEQRKDNANTEDGNHKAEISSDIQSNVLHNLHGGRRKAPSYSPEESEVDDTNEEYLEELEKAKTLLIPGVYDIQEETIIDSKEFFLNTSDEDISRWRRIIDEAKLNGTPRLICPACGQPVNLCGHKFSSGRICYFAHFKSDIECEFKSPSRKLSDEQVEQLYETHKYGNRHSDMQIKLAQALKGARSQEIGVSNVKINGSLTGLAAESSFRCPDVSAQFKGQTIAFELQLSTTFLQSIVKKDSYYKKNNIYSLWIFNFDGLNESDELSKLVSRDIFHANHNNVFVFDKEAQRRSEESGELILRCKWLDESNKWCGNEYIGLNSLMFDIKNKNLFYHPQTNNIDVDSIASKISITEHAKSSMDGSTSDETLKEPAKTSKDEMVYYFPKDKKRIYANDVPWYRLKNTKLVLPDSLVLIPHNIFKDYTSMTSIEIPKGVTKIDYGAFEGCNGLKYIKIPNSVVVIEHDAFLRCSGLISIEIPDSVKKIGHNAFGYCKGLTSIKLPNSITKIDSGVFRDCTGLTSIEIPNSVTVIHRDAFKNCAGLASIEIPDSVTEIGPSAFAGCTGLTTVKIPNSVTEIGPSAFAGCTELTTVKIPNSVMKIHYGAFMECSSIESIIVPEFISDIEAEQIVERMQLSIPSIQIIKKENETIIEPTKVAKEEKIYYFPKGLKRISNLDLPRNKNEYTTFVIPESVREVLDSTFACCTEIITIEIPNSVTEIGNNAFKGCTGLTSIGIPDGVTQISKGAFIHCTGLTSIKIPDNVTAIGPFAFSGCTGLTSVSIPNSVTRICDHAFEGCTGIDAIEIPNSVTEIGRAAFEGCTRLSSIKISNSVIQIGSFAFSDCTSLISIEIPGSVTVIGMRAFYNTAWFNNQPDGVVYAGKITYCYKGSMINNTAITLKNDASAIADYAFSECTGLTSIEIPNSVTDIGDCAFEGCIGLTSIVIPDCVTNIGTGIFKGCVNLESISLPKHLKNENLFVGRCWTR